MLSTKDWDCPDLTTFEARYGTQAAEDLITEICEELWSRGSGVGIDVSDVVCLDTLGDTHVITGRIEHQHAWYEFEVRNGSGNGTEVLNFELAEDAPDEALDLNAPPQLLQAALMRYSTSADYLNSARLRSINALRKNHSTGYIASMPRQVHELLGPVLGDIAYRHQDYALDAIVLTKTVVKRFGGLAALYPELSDELREVIEATAAQAGWQDRPEDFFVAGMKPVEDMGVLRL